jgi:phosphate transport system substrate-binding protein
MMNRNRAWRTGLGLAILVSVLAALWLSYHLGRSTGRRSDVDVASNSATIQLQEFLNDENWHTSIDKLGIRKCRVLIAETTRLLNVIGNDFRSLSPEVSAIMADYNGLEAVHYKLGHRLFTLDEHGLIEEIEAITAGPVPNGLALDFQPLSYPLVDGSTSTYPLGRLIACRLLNIPYQWVANPNHEFSMRSAMGARVEDYQFVTRLLRATPGENAHSRRVTTLINECLSRHTGTHTAYTNLITGKADVILVAREPSADELEMAQGKVLNVRPVALDAFVFMVNEANPVEGLTTDQIRRIYSGQIAHWPKPWAGVRLNAYIRDRNSGSQELMEQLVMRGLSFDEKFRYRDMLSGMGGPFHALRQDPHGLGFSVYYYAHYMTVSPATRLIAVDGVHPTRETIANRTYPYVTEVYVVIRDDLPEDHDARRLRDWLLSQEGQSVVAESGYIPAVNSSS